MESATRHSIWAERYDRQMEDVFAIQEEISLSIAKALEITLSPHEEKSDGERPTDNPEAYDFALRGRHYMRQRQFEYALAMFQEAVKLDPNFAPALCGDGASVGRDGGVSGFESGVHREGAGGVRDSGAAIAGDAGDNVRAGANFVCAATL